jgi:hypothetical protein
MKGLVLDTGALIALSGDIESFAAPNEHLAVLSI